MFFILSSKTLEASPIPNFFEKSILGIPKKGLLSSAVYPRIILILFKKNLKEGKLNTQSLSCFPSFKSKCYIILIAGTGNSMYFYDFSSGLIPGF